MNEISRSETFVPVGIILKDYPKPQGARLRMMPTGKNVSEREISFLIHNTKSRNTYCSFTLQYLAGPGKGQVKMIFDEDELEFGLISYQLSFLKWCIQGSRRLLSSKICPRRDFLLSRVPSNLESFLRRDIAQGSMHRGQCIGVNAQGSTHRGQCTGVNAQESMHRSQCTGVNAHGSMHTVQ